MPDDLRRGAFYAIAAAAAFAVTGALVKACVPLVGTSMTVFARNVVALLTLLPWALQVGRSGWQTQRLSAHLWRAGLGLSAMYCFFYTLGRLPLAEAMLLNYSAPLFVPFVAWLWIAERPGRTAIIAALLGFFGVALIVRPDTGGFADPAAMVGAVSGVLAAGAFIGIRRMADSEPTTRIVFHFSALSTLGSVLPLPWTWQSPDSTTLAMLLCCGFSATIGQLLLTRAYASAPAASVAPFSYVNVIFAAMIGWLLWREQPSLSAFGGAALIVASCIVLGVAGQRRAKIKQV